MEDKLISRYDILVNRYKELVSEKLSRKDFIEYNGSGLFITWLKKQDK